MPPTTETTVIFVLNAFMILLISIMHDEGDVDRVTPGSDGSVDVGGFFASCLYSLRMSISSRPSMLPDIPGCQSGAAEDQCDSSSVYSTSAESIVDSS